MCFIPDRLYSIISNQDIMSEQKSQITLSIVYCKNRRWCYYVVSTGHRFGVEAEALETLSHSAFRVYMEISRSCGQASWAISRRSLAVKLKLSMRTISRAVRELRDKDMIQVTPENRLHICGNRGQTFNRFRVYRLPERHLRRARRNLLFLALLLATPP